MNAATKYDLIIIGAGAGGLSVAAGASQLGYKVALVEKGEMGGDCLNTGCVPSKALLAAAKKAHTIDTSGHFGIHSKATDIDFAAVKKHVFDVIDQIAPHDSQARFESLGVRVIREKAEFVDKQTIKAGDQYLLTAKNIVIASGSSPTIPSIEGLDKKEVLTNETIFDLKQAPEHLIIIGGGPIGIEMAQAHKRLGSKVTVLDIASILPKDEPELVDILRQQLKKENIQLLENIQIKSIQHEKEAHTIQIEKNGQKQDIKGSHILIATGRTPNIDGLNLEKAGVAYTKKGVTVDQRLRTSPKNIYAIGDVTGSPQFTHIAGYHAGILVRNILFKIPAKVNYDALPWVTYTDPELAHAGLTESTAREIHGDHIQIINYPLKDNHRAVAEHQTDGLIKIILAKNSKILGASIIAPNAGDLIGPWELAISQGLKISAFTKLIAAYPTLNEASKYAAASFYTPKLFSSRTRALVRLLKGLPF